MQISGEAQRFAHDNTKAEVALSASIKSHDELGSLARVIDKMEEDVINYINNLTRVTHEKEQIKAELNLRPVCCPRLSLSAASLRFTRL